MSTSKPSARTAQVSRKPAARPARKAATRPAQPTRPSKAKPALTLADVLDTIAPRSPMRALELLGYKLVCLDKFEFAGCMKWPWNICALSPAAREMVVYADESVPTADIFAAMSAELEHVLRPLANKQTAPTAGASL